MRPEQAAADRRARNLREQARLHQLFLSFLAGEINADEYESDLSLTLSDAA